MLSPLPREDRQHQPHQCADCRANESEVQNYECLCEPASQNALHTNNPATPPTMKPAVQPRPMNTSE